jgi:hypothetical protein
MTYFQISIISACSILLPLIASMLRFKLLYQRYFPLVLLLWIGFFNELISYTSIRMYGSNLANANLYTLIEFILLLWFFHRLNAGNSIKLIVAVFLGISAWVIENLILYHFWNDNLVFRLISFLSVVFLSIDKINQLLFNSTQTPYKKIDLLFALSIFISFAYQSYIMIFALFSIHLPPEFYVKLWWILSILNILTNFVYMIAILWIPKQLKYTLR